MTHPNETGSNFPPSGMTGNPEFSEHHPTQGSDPCQSAGAAGSPQTPQPGSHAAMNQAPAPGMNGPAFSGQPPHMPAGPPPGMAGPHQAMYAPYPAYSHYGGPAGMAPGHPMPCYTPDIPAYPHPGMSYSGVPYTGFPGQAAGGGAQPSGDPQAGHAPGCGHADHGPGHPKHDAHQYGQFMGLVNDLANGKADPSQVMSFLGGLDGQFLKGALVGIGATLLLTSDSVRKGLTGTLSGIFGTSGKDPGEATETGAEPRTQS